jgi:DNA-directed RNA polymerase subunit N (RpoN/RPB10)
MVKGYSRCIKCGRVIATVEQVETDKGFTYIKHNEECRYIDKLGFDRNFCKECMKKGR